MSPFRTIDPEVLRNYHHLTPQQINKIYGCKVISESPASTAVSLANFRELCLIAEAFQQSNIDFISLKGPLLAYRLNSDVTSRYYTDLDILIEPLSVDKADRVLGELGYTNSGVAWPRNERKQRRLSWHDNQIGYCHTDRMLIVELHWRLFATPSVSDKQLLDIVGSNLTEILISGRSFKVLSNELELLYLIIHGGNHFWKRLK